MKRALQTIHEKPTTIDAEQHTQRVQSVSRVRDNELIVTLRGRYCLLYGCIGDSSGAVVAHLFDTLRHYWLVEFGDQFQPHVARTPDAGFVRLFELMCGQVVHRGAGTGEACFRSESGAPPPPGGEDLRLYDGLVYDNTPAARTVKRFLIMFAILTEGKFRDYLAPLRALDDCGDGSAPCTLDSPWMARAAGAAERVRIAAEALDGAVRKQRVTPHVLEPLATACLDQAEARLECARASRALRMLSVPRANPFVLAALLAPTGGAGGGGSRRTLLGDLFDNVADGINGFHIGHLMDALDAIVVQHSGAVDPTQPLLDELRRASVAPMTIDAAKATTQRALDAMLPAMALSRTHGALTAAALFDGATIKHREAEQLETQRLPWSLARFGNTPDDIHEALTIKE